MITFRSSSRTVTAIQSTKLPRKMKTLSKSNARTIAMHVQTRLASARAADRTSSLRDPNACKIVDQATSKIPVISAHNATQSVSNALSRPLPARYAIRWRLSRTLIRQRMSASTSAHLVPTWTWSRLCARLVNLRATHAARRTLV